MSDCIQHKLHVQFKFSGKIYTPVDWAAVDVTSWSSLSQGLYKCARRRSSTNFKGLSCILEKTR